MRLALMVATFVAALSCPLAAETARVENVTYATRCAEEDNVFITLSARNLASFRVEALHPSYIGQVVKDSYDPDFTDCHFGPTPPPEGPFFTPRQFVMWENAEWVMVGNTDRHFWRKKNVPVRVGDRVENDIHLIQFYRKRADGRRDQVLVLYPSDGHWRAKPLPVPHLDYGVYGASFLVGPLEAEDRRKPYADYTDVVFDPATLTFSMNFVRGGSGRVRVVTVDRERTAVEVLLDASVPQDRPVLAMRSMYVTADNADVADVVWTGLGGASGRASVKDFRVGDVTAIRFGRSVISRHNTSAPDTAFLGFVFR